MRRIFRAMLAVAILAVGCARGEDGGAATGPGARVVSMVPSATLIVIQIGGIDSLVGVTKYDEPMLPEAKKSLPVVGDYEDVNKELLLKLKPTAVVVFSSPMKLNGKLKEWSEEGKFELANLRFDKMEDVWASAEVLGKLTGHEAEAKAKIAAAKGEIAGVLEKLKNVKDRPRVLYTVSTIKGVTVAGGETFVDELIKAAGGVNVGAEVGKNYPEINMELCLKLKPDVVLVGVPGEPGQQADDPRLEMWKDLPAAKSGRIFLRTDPNEQLPTLSIGGTVRELAETLHPEAMRATPFDEVKPATRGAGGEGR